MKSSRAKSSSLDAGLLGGGFGDRGKLRGFCRRLSSSRGLSDEVAVTMIDSGRGGNGFAGKLFSSMPATP
jgi:hypothetical protein